MDIFIKAKIAIKPEWCGVLIGFTEICGSCLSVYLIDKSGRKVLMIGSAIGMFLAHILTAVSFIQIDYNDEVHPVFYVLPVVGILGFYVAFSLGFGGVPSVVLGEVFPHNTKGMAVSVVQFVMWIVNFGVAKLFYTLADLISVGGVFILFAMASISGGVFVWILLPETKNKSLAEIQREIRGNKTNQQTSIKT